MDGDTDFGEFKVESSNDNIKLSLPYLNGPDLCEISTNFGLPVAYKWRGGAKSRREYLDDLLKFCIDHNRASDLLSFLFSKEQFLNKLKGCAPKDIDKRINGLLSVSEKNHKGE